MSKEELWEGPEILTESYLIGVCGNRESEEEHSRQREMGEVEEYVAFKATPKFMLADRVHLAGAGWN